MGGIPAPPLHAAAKTRHTIRLFGGPIPDARRLQPRENFGLSGPQGSLDSAPCRRTPATSRSRRLTHWSRALGALLHDCRAVVPQRDELVSGSVPRGLSEQSGIGSASGNAPPVPSVGTTGHGVRRWGCMALIACRECTREISSEALTCPHCGAPRIIGTVASCRHCASARGARGDRVSQLRRGRASAWTAWRRARGPHACEQKPGRVHHPRPLPRMPRRPQLLRGLLRQGRHPGRHYRRNRMDDRRARHHRPLSDTPKLQDFRGPSYTVAILMDDRIRGPDW